MDAPALVREARRRAGLSQRELGDRAGVPQSSVGRIEAGLVSPSLEMIGRLLAGTAFEVHAELRPRPLDDPVVAAYKRDIDRTLLRENLAKTAEERVGALQALSRLADEAQRAGRRLRRKK